MTQLYLSPPSYLMNISFLNLLPGVCRFLKVGTFPDARSSCADQIMENICQDRVTLSDINKVVIPLLVQHQLKCHRHFGSEWSTAVIRDQVRDHDVATPTL